ncbi:MAG TPA: NAD(P)H-hydrate dehydratase, partial [Bryobacteraceae bacterium]|nr:NAD(P)H-hydrate dehydratase [Bryobacteraceae bacterium]
GMQSDSGLTKGVKVESPHATVTFTAPKPCHVLSPNCDELGELRVAPIGTPSRLLEASKLHLSEPSEFRSLLAPRARESNKGTYGHVLVLGGAAGKHGAALMTGLAALRSGAGLVTVASSAEQLGVPELMTARLPSGIGELGRLVDRKDVLAVGPGLGSSPEHVQLVRDLVSDIDLPMTIDADGLNALVGCSWNGGSRIRVLTPHPGEMARLLGVTIPDVQADRVYHASRFATSHGCILVLKGYRTVIALPDGRCWINPTGTPALATGGTGDILAGMIAAFLHTPDSPPHLGVLAAVFLHGLAAQIGERTWGERGLIATDILTYLPEALRECTRVSDRI